MTLPGITIMFCKAAEQTVQNLDSLTAGVLLTAESVNQYILTSEADIPAALDNDSADYIKRTFWGNDGNQPRRVLVRTLREGETPDETLQNLTEALDWLDDNQVDIFCLYPTAGETEKEATAEWVAAKWTDGSYPRALLTDYSANHEGVINYTTALVESGENRYMAAEYASRIVGLICATPLSKSATSAVLPELTGCTRLSKAQMEQAQSKGELFVYYDGEKVKLSRAITSLTTITGDKSTEYQKIKLVGIIAKIQRELKRVIADHYIGKFPNNYDSKCILITAVQTYLNQLEAEGLLESDTSTVSVDLDAQKRWLEENGKPTAQMTEQEIKEANTGSKVFLVARAVLMDAIENINLIFNI